MTILLVAGMLLGGMEGIEAHRVTLDHSAGAVEAVYRGAVDVAHRQLGTVAGAGRASTLRCHWSAMVRVEREARHPAGHLLSRSIASEAPLSGSRAGWCEGQRGAIVDEVARRADRLRDHVIDVAARDREVLLAELDASARPRS
ncbi:hypothetical protein ACM61V_05165 [Sphingomonas sp. TX0543]|uniref:hypothetical protein n=1 Tax=unclassified Sphingomonas TaxID=196159 RepID=UPI0020164365|nr:hypothetical protein [Sphingomonas sp. 3P27F8]